MKHALAPLLFSLDALPVLAYPPRRLRLDLAEHVRVPPHQLLVHVPGHGLQSAAAFLLEEEREEIHLEQEVAELVEELGRIVREGGVGDLVRLLDRVRHDRARRLLTVPRALAPQPPGQLLEVEESLRERVALSHRPRI